MKETKSNRYQWFKNCCKYTSANTEKRESEREREREKYMLNTVRHSGNICENRPYVKTKGSTNKSQNGNIMLIIYTLNVMQQN
jgi:hypothetical protein